MRMKMSHKEQLGALHRAGGQIKGIQRMIEQEKYCVDIVIQLHAVINALYRISEKVFAKHIEGCVRHAFTQGTKADKQRKIDEIVNVMKMLHKLE
jgi:DNA-binding FrmR family transcriptional regulator